MNLELPEKILNWQHQWKTFAQEVISSYVDEIESTSRLPNNLILKLREFKILHPFLPSELGGQDLDLFDLTVLLEEIARHSPAVALLLAQQVVIGIRTNLACFNFYDHRSMALQVADFEAICSLAATELEAGSDLNNLMTASRRLENGSYEISGGKAYVNWAQRAHWLITLTKPSDIGKGTTLILVKMPNSNVKVGEIHDTLGMKGIESSPVTFENAIIPESHIAGVAGFGQDIYDRMINELRICLAAIATGLSQQIFDDAANHAKIRKQFGQPIGRFQSLQWRFSDAALKIDASRLHVWHAVEIASNKSSSLSSSSIRQAAMAKIFATEAAFWVADFGMQVLGSKAYVKPNRIERLFRDARFLKIALGTSEILRNKLAERL